MLITSRVISSKLLMKSNDWKEAVMLDL